MAIIAEFSDNNMDELLEKEATEFAEWLIENSYAPSQIRANSWYKRDEDKYAFYTSKELYDEWKKQKKSTTEPIGH